MRVSESQEWSKPRKILTVNGIRPAPSETVGGDVVLETGRTTHFSQIGMAGTVGQGPVVRASEKRRITNSLAPGYDLLKAGFFNLERE